jgi:hypothetical protein
MNLLRDPLGVERFMACGCTCILGDMMHLSLQWHLFPLKDILLLIHVDSFPRCDLRIRVYPLVILVTLIPTIGLRQSLRLTRLHNHQALDTRLITEVFMRVHLATLSLPYFSLSQ